MKGILRYLIISSFAVVALLLVVNAERLPTVGSDSGDWGTILNEFLGLEHASDGTHGNVTAEGVNVSGIVNITGKILASNNLTLRGPEPWIDVRAYGAVGNGLVDDATAIQNAIDDGITYNAKVYFPYGTYLVNSQINITIGSGASTETFSVYGDWPTIRANASMDSVFYINTTSFFRMEKFVIDASSNARHGIIAHKLTNRNAILQELSISRAKSDGLFANQSQLSVFRNIVSSNNNGSGFHLIDCNGLVLEKTIASINNGSGYLVEGDVNSGKMWLRDVDAETNQRHGIELTRMVQGGPIIDGGWLENNVLDGVFVNSSNTVVTNLNILAAPLNGNKAIRITTFANGTRVIGNSFTDTNFSATSIYRTVRDSNVVNTSYIQGNTYLFASDVKLLTTIVYDNTSCPASTACIEQFETG